MEQNFNEYTEKMKTEILIEDKLLKEALKASGQKDITNAVKEALELYISLKKQGKIRKLRGKLKWEGDLSEMRSQKQTEN